MNKDEIIAQLRDMAKHPTVTLPRDCEALRAAADLLTQLEQEYKRGYADAMNWKVQNHLEHLPAAQPEQEPVGKLVSDEFDGHRFISYQNEWPFNVDLYAATPPQHALMAEHWKAEYDKLKAACKPLTDTQLRKLWAQYASKVNGWPNDATPPMVNIGNGPRFQVDWHESEYHIFRAGFEASRGIKE